ncbi:hypothetical protein V0288_22225 [Pannus brasiliensis CCIBt3594]|uniref:Uncharacterized protein n=1 Tax=Pannus brasiliensis CCIBt3594 TaxID=1427578 RepID=A0AAW9QZI2_9CHRO
MSNLDKVTSYINTIVKTNSNDTFTSKEVSNGTGIRQDNISRELRKLKNWGLIEANPKGWGDRELLYKVNLDRWSKRF